MANIWSYGLIFTLIYGLIHHQQEALFNLLFTVSQDAFKTTLVLCLNACFFNGLLNIASKSGLLSLATKPIIPFLKKLFPHASLETLDYISIHLLSLLFGLSSLASISGLKAMKQLQTTSKDLNKSMIILFLFNTTGLSFFPSTVLSLRQTYQNASNQFIPYAFLLSLITLILGIVLVHLFYHE